MVDPRLHRLLPIGRRQRRVLKRYRMRVAESFGSERYTWAALNGLDHKLVDLFAGRRGGRFLEIGANDGLQQSNTLALERLLGWNGILIEANPDLAAECARNRPEAFVVCAAASGSPGLLSVSDDDLHASTSPAGLGGHTVGAVPLSWIIDHNGDQPLDLVVIDVEGGELDVLAGLDFDRHGPDVLLVETWDLEGVAAALESHYRLSGQWAEYDYVFIRVGSPLEVS